MFCSKCGAELKDTVKFCPSCGTAVESSDSDKNTVNSANSLPPNVTLSSNPDAIVLKSSAPISTKNAWAKWAYIISLLLTPVGAGVLGLIFTFIIEHFIMSSHRDKMRRMKFQFVKPVTADDIYNKLQPALNQKLGNKVEFDRDDETVSVRYNSIIYDINLQEDGTFCVWWRKSLGGAIFSWNEWKLYKKIRTGTALVAYELQKQFGVN